MAMETDTRARIETESIHWTSAIWAALLAGVVMGFMLQFVMGMMPMIGALYGAPGLVTGWIAHLFHSVVFGLVYAVIAGRPAVAAYATRTGTGVGLGVAYGIVIWIVGAGIVMPLWMGALGMPAPGVPNLDPMSLVGHVVFGALLGGGYALLVRR